MNATAILRCLVAIVTLMHIALFAQHSFKQVIWRLRRHEGCSSDTRRWRQQVLKYPSAIGLVNRLVPGNARLQVGGSRPLCHELAFYCFPRVVTQGEHGSGSDEDGPWVIEKVGVSEWHLRRE